MDNAKHHWKILQKLGNDLENRVREFMVIGKDGKGVIVVTENGEGYWLGEMWFGMSQTKTATNATALDVPGLVQMAQSENHILLLNKQGQIYSMGLNGHGQLGLGTKDEEIHFSPQLISIPQKFISIRCGRWHSLALAEDGKVWAWGSNVCGSIGVLSSTAKRFKFPRQISQLDPHRVVAVECGGLHSLALTDQGEVYGWGGNYLGQLGDGSEPFQHTPTKIPAPSPVQSMAAGAHHTLLLTQTGEVYACGRNGCGQLGLPITIRYTPHLSKVAGLPPISQIASFSVTELSIAMSSDKRCFVWGELQDGTSNFTPLKLPPLFSTVESPFSSSSFNCTTPCSVSILDSPKPIVSDVRQSRNQRRSVRGGAKDDSGPSNYSEQLF